METAVRRDALKKLLRAVRNQYIGISVCNEQGIWSGEYFQILDVQEFGIATEKLLVLVLHSERDSRCFAVDANRIHGLRFNKYLQFDQSLIREATILSTEEALHVS